MAHMTEVNDRMRAILIDWLIQVHLRFRLLQETLYITISLLDRFLSVSNPPIAVYLLPQFLAAYLS